MKGMAKPLVRLLALATPWLHFLVLAEKDKYLG